MQNNDNLLKTKRIEILAKWWPSFYIYLAMGTIRPSDPRLLCYCNKYVKY